MTVSQVAGSNIYTPRYYSTDHLGSVRTVIDGGSGQTVEKNDYDPFGSRIVDAQNEISDNRYRYNGKEEQAFLKLPFIDYGARMYDPKIAMRWNRPDPLAEKYSHISPYAFCANNPINFVDPNGMDYYKSVAGAVIWKDLEKEKITINNEVFKNIGKSYSIQLDEESFANFYQNVFISVSSQAVDAGQTVLNNAALTGALLSQNSPLTPNAQQGLMNDVVRQAQSDFINHPVTQTAIDVMAFVATGGIEGIAAITKAAGGLTTRQAAIQTTKIVGNAVTGFTEHGLNQVIDRGFKPQNILQILKNGQKVQSMGRYGPQIKYTLGGNTIVVNKAGKIVTAFGPRPGTFIPF